MTISLKYPYNRLGSLLMEFDRIIKKASFGMFPYLEYLVEDAYIRYYVNFANQREI